MNLILAAKTITDLTFGGAFAWYLIKALFSAAVAYAAILLGIRWRKAKDQKKRDLCGDDK